MPKLFEYLGIAFYFYAKDHLPIHVHASYGDYETIFELIFKDGKLSEVRTRKSAGIEPLPKAKLSDAQTFVEHYADEIVERWEDFFIRNNKKVKAVKITKKI